MGSDLLERAHEVYETFGHTGNLKSQRMPDAVMRAVIAFVLEEAAKEIEEGFDRGIKTKRDQCLHGRFGWEDCEPCCAAAIRALIPTREGE